jgi:hypothetical protein
VFVYISLFFPSQHNKVKISLTFAVYNKFVSMVLCLNCDAVKQTLSSSYISKIITYGEHLRQLFLLKYFFLIYLIYFLNQRGIED